jgi:hypothetical protein
MGAVKHAKQTGLPADDGDTSVVQPSDWYADHDGGLQTASVTLSSADILALDSTPVTLVAAPGAGHWLVVHRVILAVDFATTPYANGDTWPGVYYAGPGPLIKSLDILSQGSSARSMESPTVGADATNTDNVAIVAAGGSASTDGDSTLTITVWYSIETAP